MIKKAKNKNYPKTIITPIKSCMHNDLKEISFYHKLSINKIVRMALEKTIDNYKKKLD